MTTEQLYKELSYVNHSRENRLKYANLIIENPELIPKLLEILFMVTDKIAPRAAWVLEFACSENINIILPHLTLFTEKCNTVRLDSAVRPVAKICEHITKSYYLNHHLPLKNALTEEHKMLLIENCFDYMINNEKVAAKAYAMTSLYLFGAEFKWIHPELKTILERDFPLQSAAFQARAKHIFKKLKQKK